MTQAGHRALVVAPLAMKLRSFYFIVALTTLVPSVRAGRSAKLLQLFHELASELQCDGARVNANMDHAQMPTDVLAAMQRRAAMNRQLSVRENVGVLLIPLCMCMMEIIAALESQSFATAVIAMGLN
jgi:hypothetical protein